MSKIPGYKLRRMWNNEISISPQVIQNFADSFTLPYRINIWYYYFLTQQSFQEPSVITNWIIDADIQVTTDVDKLNIIYYLVKSKEITSLNTIFKRAEEALDNAPMSVFTSLSDVMDDIIASKVPHLSSFLETCVGPPEIAGQKMLKLGDTQGMHLYVFSNERKLTTKILNTLVKDGTDPLVFYTSKVQLDPNFNSKKNLKIFEAVFKNSNLEIYRSKLILRLIDAAWSRARPFLWAKAIIDVGFLACLSIFVSFKPDSPPQRWFVNFLFGYNSLLLVYELLQLTGNYKIYIRSVLNLLDLLRISLIYATLLNTNTNSQQEVYDENDDEASPKVAGVVIFAIFFNYLKLITHFRLLKPARRLIRMLVETVSDMATFSLFFGIITAGLSFMMYLAGILFSTRDEISLGQSLGNVYQMSLGQFATSTYDALSWGLFALSTFLLAIVLLPLLISIIGDTFARGRANAIPSDYIEKLDLILESFFTLNSFKKVLMWGRKSSFRRNRRDQESQNKSKKYLFWVAEVHAESENEKEEASWETGLRDIRKDLETHVRKHNASTIQKIGLIAKAMGTLMETKKQSWKLYCKEMKLSDKAQTEYILAKRDLYKLKKKLDISVDMSSEEEIDSELSFEDETPTPANDEKFIQRGKRTVRRTVY